MSIFASILRSVYKLSGAKKAFALPEDALRKEIEKQNRHRGVFTPTDRKAYYETIAVNGFPCLIVREHPKPSERAILYFFGGGMVIGPDMLLGAKQETSRLLGDDADERQVRQILIRRQRSDPQKSKHFQR